MRTVSWRDEQAESRLESLLSGKASTPALPLAGEGVNGSSPCQGGGREGGFAAPNSLKKNPFSVHFTIAPTGAKP